MPFWSRLASRVSRAGVAGEGWSRVVRYQMAVTHGDRAMPRLLLTLGRWRRRRLDPWPRMGDDDFLAIAALLALRARWFSETTRTLATAPRALRLDGRWPESPLATVISFDASWRPEVGGWISLRFGCGAAYTARFAADAGALFAASVAAASADESVFDARACVLRSLPHGAPIGRLDPAWG